MGRSFSDTFGFVEPRLGFAELLLEMTNPAVQCSKILLRRQIEAPGDLLNVLVDGALDTPSKAERPERELLDLGVFHHLSEPRILHELEQPFFERGHGAIR